MHERRSAGSGVGNRRAGRRPGFEALESRQVLSTTPMTLTMPAAADGMINGVATSPVLVFDGRTMPNASVQLQVGRSIRTTHSDSSGNYKFALTMPSGTYQAQVTARDRAGRVEKASMTATVGDAVIAWVDTMIEVIKADIANVGLASRTQAMVSGAVYDAVNDVQRTGAVYKFDVKAPSGASASAAASEAAYTVLSALDPSMAPLLEVTMAQSLAAVPSAKARQGGIAVGLQVGEDMLAWRASDGSSATVPYVPGTAPGQWRPTPPTYQVAWGPEWGQVATFAVTVPVSYFQPPPPPALDSPEYLAVLGQVATLGALDSPVRTADQTQIADFWSYDTASTGTPPVHYDEIAESIALQMHNSLTQDARLFGLVNVSMGDSGIAAWNAKYTYNRWRPITAIQEFDPAWEPLGSPGDPGQPNFTPPFPSYVSGHATFGADLFTMLADFYGTDNVRFTLTSDILPGVTRSYSSFSQASSENAISRIYLGIHYWFDESAGMTMGTSIANDVFANVMKTNKRR